MRTFLCAKRKAAAAALARAPVLYNRPYNGTVIIDVYTGEVVTEILKPGSRTVILKGGRGGLGNLHFKSPTNQAPMQATPGQPGEEGRFTLV